MIPTGSRTEFLKEQDLKIGMEVMVMTELVNDERFKSFLVGKILLTSGEERLLGMNQTSYYNVSKNQAFGPDTKDWVGKRIKYLGKTKLKNRPVMANLWEAVEPVVELDKTPF